MDVVTSGQIEQFRKIQKNHPVVKYIESFNASVFRKKKADRLNQRLKNAVKSGLLRAGPLTYSKGAFFNQYYILSETPNCSMPN